MDEKQRMTIFGAREPSSAARAPRRLGIFLTLFFLFLLAAVGIWAAVSIDGGLARLLGPAQEEAKAAQAPDTAETATPSESQADASPDVPQPDSATVAPELATEENLADADNFAEAEPEPAGADIEAPAPEETSAPAMRPALDDLSPDAARARYAATGIWQRAPEVPSAPRAGDTEDIYQTSIDAPLDIRDAVALPDPNATRAGKRPPTPVSPPAPGTRFDFDERGLVRATEDGAMTPDGIRVFAGGPPVTPPPTPARPETAALADAIEIDPALATVRPRLRPDDLSELNERGFLGGRTRRELAELGPRIRPEAIGQRAQAAQATAASEPENDGDTTAAFEDPTPQAIAASLKPNTRPGDFQQIVGETRANRQSEPVSAAQRASPNIPTTASVARRATERNAMRLRRLNLIGVYGTPNSRRALVRLSNGRYRKVQVGDRLDGGRVSAIDDDRLLYTKRGRSVVLRMPRG
ncbi:MAG: hypothetical protein RI571_14315 [Roseovarius sp.]|nr:hypothetical protein [Roseovarius sp.]